MVDRCPDGRSRLLTESTHDRAIVELMMLEGLDRPVIQLPRNRLVSQCSQIDITSSIPNGRSVTGWQRGVVKGRELAPASSGLDPTLCAH